jgi:hypothetical protein
MSKRPGMRHAGSAGFVPVASAAEWLAIVVELRTDESFLANGVN